MDNNKSILRYSKPVTLILLICFLFFLPCFKHRKINNNLEENVLQNSQLKNYYKFVSNFGNDRLIIFAFPFQPDDPNILKALFEIENKLLKTGYVHKIFSPLTILKEVFLIYQKPEFDKWITDEQRVKNYYKIFENFSILRKSVISKDGKSASLIVHLDDSVSDTDIEKIKFIKNSVLNSPFFKGKSRVAGIPDIVRVIHEYTLFSQKYFTPSTVLIIMAVLFILYYSFRTIAISLASIILPLVLTMGIFNYMDNSSNFIISMIPPLILGVALTSCIHLLTDYFKRAKNSDNFDINHLKDSLKELSRPILLCQITTFCGFASLASNGLGAIKQYGIYSGLSIIFILLSSLFVLPALINFFKLTNQKITFFQANDIFFEKIGKFILKRKSSIITAVFIIFLLSIYGLSKISIQTSLIKYLPEDHQVIKNIHAIEKMISGIVPVQLAISDNCLNRASKDIKISSLLKPETCLRIAKFQEELLQIKNVDFAMSYVDLIMDYDRTFSGEKDNIPPSAEEVKEYLQFYIPRIENKYVTNIVKDADNTTKEITLTEIKPVLKGPDKGVAGFITNDYKDAQISMRIKDVDSNTLNKIFEQILKKADHYFGKKGSGIEYYLTGRAYLWAVTSEILVRNEILNFFMALIFIDLIMMYQFRSIRIGLAALIPNVLPIMVIFGIMGFLNIPVNTVTGIIACVAIGMSVDDTIHYIHSYMKQRSAGICADKSVIIALQEKGSSMIFTTIVIMAGFSILMLSKFIPTFQFGLLISGVFLMALLFDLIVTPAVLILLEKTKDIKAPQKNIIPKKEF